jgi:hypothetical protein
MSGEGRSRADIGLPGLQQELLKEIESGYSKEYLIYKMKFFNLLSLA